MTAAPEHETVSDAPSSTRRWLVLAVAAVAIVAVAFAIGRFTAFGASAVPPAPSTSSAEAGFARDMQVHHAQAVQMAMEIYRKTEDPELRILSYDIATTQSGQRGEMYGWLVQWGLSQSGGPLMAWMQESPEHAHGGGDSEALSDEQLRAEMGMATDAQVAELAEADGSEADCLFLELMIRHHQGAVPMAEAVIDLGDEPRVRTVAEAIVSGQTAEIDAMQSMQARLGCSA